LRRRCVTVSKASNKSSIFPLFVRCGKTHRFPFSTACFMGKELPSSCYLLF
jgi:hypothetical protein